MEALGARWAAQERRDLLAAWRDVTVARAGHRRTAASTLGRLQGQQLRRLLAAWLEAARRLAKLRATVAGAMLRRDRAAAAAVLAAWRVAAAAQRRRSAAGGAVALRWRRGVLAACLGGWRGFVARKQQTAAARSYAASHLARASLLGWQAVASDAARRVTHAHERGASAAARNARALASCVLRAWRAHAWRMAGAACMLRRQLVGTLGGAFAEWRAAAAERAHWRRVRGRGEHINGWGGPEVDLWDSSLPAFLSPPKLSAAPTPNTPGTLAAGGAHRGGAPGCCRCRRGAAALAQLAARACT
jgi:hypothetical protein